MNAVIDAINKRRSIRAYEAKPVPRYLVNAVISAGNEAPSAMNSQPWHFIAVQNKGTLQQLSTMGDFLGHVAGAALCVVICLPEENERTLWHFFDAGQSASYMQLAALEVGVGSCLGTIYKPDATRELLGIPAGWQARLLISFGYPAEQPPRPPKPDGRRAFDDVVHEEKW
jgi:nitroreductase